MEGNTDSEKKTEETINTSQNTTPLNLDAIPSGETQSAKSSEQEVINMLLAQHGIIPVSNSLDVPTFTVQTSPTFNATNLVSEKNGSSESDSKNIVLPSMVQHEDMKQDNADDSSMTTFVAEDGQGGHIIISGAAEYQDGSVVQMAGQQVSRVAEGQLITIASGESAPVSIAALDNFGTDHVQMGTDDNGDDSGGATSYYVLEDHVAMVDGQTQLDTNDQDVSKKVYQCTMDGCGKQFSTPYRLKAHGRSHTGQTFSCEEEGCHKTFITHSDLNKHTRTHTGDKPFFCDFENCGKVYSTAHHLKVC